MKNPLLKACLTISCFYRQMTAKRIKNEYLRIFNSEYIESYHEELHRTYYTNIATNKSQWNRPSLNIPIRKVGWWPQYVIS